MNRVGVHALVWVGGWSEAECRTAKQTLEFIDAGLRGAQVASMGA